MRTIEVDYNKLKGPKSKYSSMCVGAGRAAEVLRKDFQDHLDTVSKECGFKYLRFHGIFHDDMGVYTEDKSGESVYNWQYVDLVYDAILDRGMKPFVELGFMPKKLASGEKTVFWWTANVTPPKDYEKWYQLIFNFVSHLEDRYGREEVTTWYFEVWNEADIPNFFSSTMEEYYKMYDVASKAIKDVCSRYRVGGPATADNKWVGKFIEYCYENKRPIDFVSTHIYGIKGAFDEFGDRVFYLFEDKETIISRVKAIFDEVRSSKIPDLEIHYTEWSSSYSSRDPIHDTYIQAPYILYNLKHLEGTVDSMSYWTFTDVFEEVGPPPSPFHGGFGMINLQSLKKPAFFAYKYLNELGDIELSCEDSDSWACRSDKGVQLLLWDYTKPLQDDNNQKYFKKIIPSKTLSPISLKLKGLPAGKYLLEVHLVGYASNDVYNDYVKMGAPGTLKKEEVSVLGKNNSGKPIYIKEIKIGEEGQFDYMLDIRENDVYFVKLTGCAV